jgi:acyl-coenzyme A thioesterase PaaI-like protein
MERKQPGSRTCFVCGRENPVGLKLDFFTQAPGQVRSDLDIPEVYEGYPGVVHGGIIASILDETGGRAFMDDPTLFMVTAQLNVRYRKPVPSRTTLIALGMAGERRGRVSYAHSEIRNLDSDVLAEADLVLVDIPKSQIEAWDPEVLGWKVYPDSDEEEA